MVRTYPVASAHFDPARVAAWSAAIALHLLAFLLLLVPATYQAITALPRDDTTVRLIPRELPPPPAPRTEKQARPRNRKAIGWSARSTGGRKA